jgi:hypothetical protein
MFSLKQNMLAKSDYFEENCEMLKQYVIVTDWDTSQLAPTIFQTWLMWASYCLIVTSPQFTFESW